MRFGLTRLFSSILMQICRVGSERLTGLRQPPSASVAPAPEPFSAVSGMWRENRAALRSADTRHLPAHVTQLRREQVWQEANVFVYLRGIYTLLQQAAAGEHVRIPARDGGPVGEVTHSELRRRKHENKAARSCCCCPLLERSISARLHRPTAC